MAQALEGLHVLDLTRVLAGPYATMILADLGADVIKLEMPISGDDARAFPPHINGESAYFMSLNRNKRSMTLNLKTTKGKELFKDMIRRVDVIVENFRPGTMERLGLGYDVLCEENSRLIYAAASGFGHTGPYSRRPAYDAIVQAMGGIMSITGQVGGTPTRVGSSIGDITAGMFTTIGILTALAHREKTGLGQKVDVSMLDSQVAILENAIARYTAAGEIPTPIGNRHPSITPFEPFDTKDGQLMVAVGNNVLWSTFCSAIAREELLDDPRFETNALRTANQSELRPLLAEPLLQKRTAEWRELFDTVGIPNGPINSVDEVVVDPQVVAREMIVEVDHPVAGKTSLPGIPIKLSATPGAVRQSAPLLGQHTVEILRDVLGYSPQQIADLEQHGIF
ncbi:MAG: CoA transferase [Chloroflexi bacterium]|jgi:CoA:oxalate CoA-transferase|nr:CoA transferase [Chloroflexota bacterium]